MPFSFTTSICGMKITAHKPAEKNKELTAFYLLRGKGQNKRKLLKEGYYIMKISMEVK